MSQAHSLPALPSTDLLIAFDGYERAVLCLSGKTVRNHRIYLEACLGWWRCGHGLEPVTTATPGEVAAFLIAEAKRGLAPRTRRSELGALRGFYNWLVLTGRALTNPGAVVPSPRISAPPIEIYTPAESIAILDHTASLTDLRGRQRHAIVATLRHSGMRSGELRTLRRADLDLSAGRAMVVGKGSRQRMVLLPPGAVPDPRPVRGSGPAAAAVLTAAAGQPPPAGDHTPVRVRHGRAGPRGRARRPRCRSRRPTFSTQVEAHLRHRDGPGRGRHPRGSTAAGPRPHLLHRGLHINTGQLADAVRRAYPHHDSPDHH